MDLIKKYKLFFVLIFTSFTGNLLVIYYLSKGFTYAQIGTVTAITTLGVFLFEVPTGVVGDKLSRKTSVLIGLLIHASGAIILLNLKNYPMLILYSIIAPLGASFVSGSLQAWFFDNLKYLGREKEYRQIMKEIKTITVLVLTTTLIIGGFLAQLCGFKLPLLLTLAVEIMAFITAYAIPEYEFKKPKHSYLTHTLQSFREIRKPELLWLIIISILVSLATNQFRKFFEPYLGKILAENLKTTLMGTLGILGIVEATVKVIPKLIGIRLKDSWSLKAYQIAPMAIPLFTALSVLYQNPLWIIALGIIVTVIHTAFGFNLGIEFQHRIPSEKRATILSLNNMASALVMSVFYFIYGFAVDWLGLSKARLIFALLLLGAGTLLKAGEIAGIHKEVLKLKHIEAPINK